MAIQNYNTLVSALTQFSNAHLSLRRFKCSFFEQFDNFSTSGNSFPILYAVPSEVSFDENIDRFTFRVYCVDILQKDRSNESNILNETLLILRDLTNWLKLDSTNDLNILNIPRATPVNNFLVDYTCGWYIDIEVEASVETNDCSIPFTDNFIFSAITCSDTYVSQFLTCDTLAACSTFINLENRVDVLEAEVDVLNSIVLAQNQLLSGGASFLSGLTYSLTPLTYIINGTFYSAVTSTVTVASGDTTYDRIDVIVADISGNTSVVQGTPSTNPVSPDINELTQVQIALITVAAGASSLATAFTLVYNEKVGPPTEWTFATTSSPFISGDSTTVSYSGTVAIELSAATNAKVFTLSSSTVFDSVLQNSIQFAIKNRIAWPGAVGATRLRFTILSSTGVQIGTFVDLYNGRFGFSSTSTAWQILSIPLSNFALTSTLFSTIRVTTVNTGSLAINASLDLIKMIVSTPLTSTLPSWFNIRDTAGTSIPPLVTNDTLTFSGTSGIGVQVVSPRTVLLTYTGTSGSGIFTGGTVNGPTNFTAGLSATTISATTYYGDGSQLTGIPRGFSGWTGSTGIQSIKANNDTANLASGQYSVAEGFSTTASNLAAHSEGGSTIASGQYSHAQGTFTVASGGASHSEGGSTTASGLYSHAGGVFTIASGNHSFVQGSASTATGIGTIVLGDGITGTSDNTVYTNNLGVGLGVGLLAPTAKTSIKGNGTTIATSALDIYSSANTKMYDFTDSGRLYLYNPAGTSILTFEVDGASVGYPEVSTNKDGFTYTSGKGEYLYTRSTASGNNNILMYTNGKRFDLSATAGGTPNMTISQLTGYIGFNTTTPTVELTVEGRGSFTGGITANTINLLNATGTSISTLGIDATGRIVSGATSGGSFTGGTVTGPTVFTSSVSAATYYNIPDTIGVTFDGQTGTISTGATTYRVMGYSGRITAWDLVATTTGTCVIDIWKIASGSTLPTVVNSITDAAKPTLSSGFIASNSNLSTWTGTTFNTGDIIAYNVDSATTVTRITLSLRILKQ